MAHFMPRRLFVFALPFALSACGIDDWANTHMPVLGDRCEHWQCFTESGREESEANRQERLREQAGGGMPGGQVPAGNPMTATAPMPATPSGAPAAPPKTAYVAPDPMAPGMGPVPTYQYVPRGPSAPGSTPFDGNIQPIEPPAE